MGQVPRSLRQASASYVTSDGFPHDSAEIAVEVIIRVGDRFCGVTCRNRFIQMILNEYNSLSDDLMVVHSLLPPFMVRSKYIIEFRACFFLRQQCRYFPGIQHADGKCLPCIYLR